MKESNDEKAGFFKFEENGRDFPFYKDNPKLSIERLVLLTISVIIPMILVLIPYNIGGRLENLLIFIIPFFVFGLVTNWKYDLICKKFHRSDFKLIIILIVLELIFSMIMGLILLSIIHLNIQANPGGGELNSILFWIIYPFQIFGEELIKILPFLILLTIFYKLSENRKTSIIISTILVLLIFGLIHFPAYQNIFSVLLLQGLGSIFTMFGYLKTKNIFVTFIIHILYDFFTFIPSMLQ